MNFSGAATVQRGNTYSNTNKQKPLAIKTYLPYHLTHSGWMVLIGVEVHLPHNPLVLGSSPSCPTFLTYSSTTSLVLFGGSF